MFEIGDIVRQKQMMEKVYYALIIDIKHNQHDMSLSRITAQWINWHGEIVILTQREAKIWWEKVS
jgi:hypothetical protein